MYIKSVIFLVFVVLLSGCTQKELRVDNSIKYDEDVNMEYIKSNYDLVSKKCSNTESRLFFGYIPISGIQYEFTSGYLVDQLLTECSGDIATDVDIEGSLALFLYINYYGVTTTADIWRKK